MIYAARAIDLAPEEYGGWAGLLEYISLARGDVIFDPGTAWSKTAFEDLSPKALESLVQYNQKMAIEADLLVAWVDLEVPSWGLPFEILTRAATSFGSRDTLVIMDLDQDLPVYLKWAHTRGVIFAEPTNSAIAEALRQLEKRGS